MVCEHRVLYPLAWNSSVALHAGLMKDNEFWSDCSASFSCQSSLKWTYEPFWQSERIHPLRYSCSSNLSSCVFPPVSMTWVRMTSTTVCHVRTMGMTSMRTSLRWKYDNPWWELCVTVSGLLSLGMFLSIIDVVHSCLRYLSYYESDAWLKRCILLPVYQASIDALDNLIWLITCKFEIYNCIQIYSLLPEIMQLANSARNAHRIFMTSCL